MKTKILGTKPLSQCPQCKAVKMETNNKHSRFVYQQSIVTFDKLPEELCYACKIK